MFTLDFLQHYSYIVMAALGTIFVLLQFVYSAGAMMFTLGSDDRQKTIIFKAIGNKWSFAFADNLLFLIFSLIMFPGFHSQNVGQGAGVWIFCSSVTLSHAVASEVLLRTTTPWVKKLCRIVVVIIGWLNPFLLGFIGAAMFTGIEDIELINFNYGILYLAAAQTSALLYLYCVINDMELLERIIRALKTTAPFLFVMIIATISFLFSRKGIEFDADGNFYVVELKYLYNLVEMPHVLASCIAGISLVLVGIVVALVHSVQRAFWIYVAGILISVHSLFLITCFNNTACFPCYADPQKSLTIANASADYNTLLYADIASITILPILLILMYRIWTKLNRKL